MKEDRKTRFRTDNPQPARLGERLELGTLMERVGVSLAELAEVAGISKTAMFGIVANNEWPKTKPVDEIKTAIEAELGRRGLDDEALKTVWWAKRSLRKPGVSSSPTDIYGRDPKAPRRDPAALKPKAPEERKATDMLLAKQSLTYQAAKAFNLFSNPFDGEVTRSEELFQNGELRFIREAMWQAARNGRFVAVVGESGAGKTTLLGDLEDRITRDREQVTIIRPSVLSMTESERTGRLLKAADIVTAITLTLDRYAKMPSSNEARVRQMASMVEESAKVGNSHLVVIEEAHALSVPTLQALKRLHERCRVGRRPALGILLLAHPELMGKLNERRADLREVTQRCEVVTLPPLNADLRGYLEHRAKVAGKELDDMIDESGIAELANRLTVRGHDRRDGPVSLVYPLAVNNLMTAALNVAAGIGAPKVNRDVVRSV